MRSDRELGGGGCGRVGRIDREGVERVREWLR